MNNLSFDGEKVSSIFQIKTKTNLMMMIIVTSLNTQK